MLGELCGVVTTLKPRSINDHLRCLRFENSPVPFPRTIYWPVTELPLHDIPNGIPFTQCLVKREGEVLTCLYQGTTNQYPPRLLGTVMNEMTDSPAGYDLTRTN